MRTGLRGWMAAAVMALGAAAGCNHDDGSGTCDMPLPTGPTSCAADEVSLSAVYRDGTSPPSICWKIPQQCLCNRTCECVFGGAGFGHQCPFPGSVVCGGPGGGPNTLSCIPT